ncbi:aldose epimerase family protein [Candidatus Merdisoma sp. JLR.KK006]|uniref:aldose epimerase family protein n=1 Tax=Candidatus Merdisoma sp. JLR.KK006 TaxID=3112626 RepID=UPI002FEEC033
MSIEVKDYGVTSDGQQVKQYVLVNKQGMKAILLNYGAVITELHVPDGKDGFVDVVWGYDSIAGYEVNTPGLGSAIGRNANRIGKAQITINSKVYELQKNNGENNLHGGNPGYNRRMWKGVIADDNKVEFSIESPDGDQGFPGNAKVKISYTLTEDNELRIGYEASADQDTIFNLTNHSYFNLEGQDSDDVLEHQVWMDADAFTPTDDGLIPTGEIRSVEGTPMDFRSFHALGEQIEEDYEPLKQAGGYDHNYVLNNEGAYALCCKLRSLKTGIVMEVYTDLPGMQLYCANFLDEEAGGKNGRVYGKRSAVCFESQYFPDAVHHENFKSPVFRAGDKYCSMTGYKFTVE